MAPRRSARGRRHMSQAKKWTPTYRKGPRTEWQMDQGSQPIAAGSADKFYLLDDIWFISTQADKDAVVGGIKYTIRQRPAGSSDAKPNHYTSGIVKLREGASVTDGSTPTFRLMRGMFAKETWIEYDGYQPLLVQRSVPGTFRLGPGDKLSLVIFAPYIEEARSLDWTVEYSLAETERNA